MMFVGIAKITVLVPHSQSLKVKRQVLRKVVENVRNRFPVSISEVGSQGLWQKAELGYSVVSPDFVMTEKLLHRVSEFVENMNICDIIDSKEEIFPWKEEDEASG